METFANMTNPVSLTNYYVGLSLALSSSVLIGTSFIFKKRGLIRLANRGIRAGSGGFGYLTDWVWWMGLLFMSLGEALNFVAYAFAPATLVTPLGCLSVLVTAVLSSRFLRERLNLFGKLGCVICMCGSTMVVLHAPKEQKLNSLHELQDKLLDTSFMVYVIVIIVLNAFFIFYMGPRHGTSNPLIYITISGSIGSLSVICCKVIGLCLSLTFNGHNQLTSMIFWLFVTFLVCCVGLQMNYLNKALDIFNTSVVTPLLYVFFTTFVIIASAILFKEWTNLEYDDIIGILVGFFTIIVAIVLLQCFKDLNVSLGSLNVKVMRSNSYDSMQVVLMEQNDSTQQLLSDSVADGMVQDLMFSTNLNHSNVSLLTSGSNYGKSNII